MDQSKTTPNNCSLFMRLPETAPDTDLCHFLLV